MSNDALAPAVAPSVRRRRSGAFVVVVGPDGVGKTTIARALIDQYDGPTAYFHFAPPMRGSLAPRPPEVEIVPPVKFGPSGSRLLGWIRLTRNVVRFWLGYLLSVRPVVRNGCLVVADRWMYGYLVQPHALKFYGPRWLAAILVRVMPRPDVIVNLSAPADLIRARKQELTIEQIVRELADWANLPGRVKSFDAADAPEVIAGRILREL